MFLIMNSLSFVGNETFFGGLWIVSLRLHSMNLAFHFATVNGSQNEQYRVCADVHADRQQEVDKSPLPRFGCIMKYVQFPFLTNLFLWVCSQTYV